MAFPSKSSPGENNSKSPLFFFFFGAANESPRLKLSLRSMASWKEGGIQIRTQEQSVRRCYEAEC